MRDERFQGRAKAPPGYRLSPNYFQKFKRMPAPDWAQKMLCTIVPNRRTVSPEFFSWVRTQSLLSCHICTVRSPSLCEQRKLLFSTFLTRNEGTTDESKKRLGCYQQEQFNLPRVCAVFNLSKSKSKSKCLIYEGQYGSSSADMCCAQHRGKTSTHAPSWAFPVSFSVTLSSQSLPRASFCVQLVVQLFCFMLLVFLTIW